MWDDSRVRATMLWWGTAFFAGWVQHIFVALASQHRPEENIAEMQHVPKFRTVWVKWYVRLLFIGIPTDGPLSIVWTLWQLSAVVMGVAAFSMFSHPDTHSSFLKGTLFFMICHISIHILALQQTARAIARESEHS